MAPAPGFIGGNFAAGLALAASLLFGVYLGASGLIADLLPETLSESELADVANLDDPLDLPLLQR